MTGTPDKCIFALAYPKESKVRRRIIVSGLLALGFLVVTAKVGVFSTTPIGLHPYTPMVRRFCYMFHAIPYQIGLQRGSLFFLSQHTLRVLPYYLLLWLALTLLINAIIALVRKVTLGKRV
ncbi:MAG: hypothetical protein ICV83_30835 [Cytophagales bacterium]|nr:hypothetical protein [Cytophagales bacterium]